jgi:transposase
MLTIPSDLKVWVGSQPIDMRKGCLSLSAMIEGELKHNAKSGQLFVFFGKTSRKVKIVYWDRNGFVMWYKTLAEGRFRPPRVDKPSYSMSISDLTLLLEGIDLTATRLRMV